MSYRLGGRIPPKFRIQVVYNKRADEDLVKVVTLAEAMLLTGARREQLMTALRQHRISGRVALTGGTYLFNLNSLTRIFPVLPERKEMLQWIY